MPVNPLHGIENLTPGVWVALADKRPLLRDLSECGSLAEDADLVFFLYRDSYYHQESAEPNTAELIVAKNRRGPTGTIELSFRPADGRYV